MVVALQMVQNRVAEITGELPAGTELAVERMTPEIFPVFILSLTGDAADRRPARLRELRRQAGTGARAGRRASSRCQASDTREIEVVLDPAKLAAAGLTVVDVADALKAQNTLLPVGRFQESGLQHLTLASGLWKSVDQIAQAPVKVKNGATIRVADLGTVTRGAPDRTLLVTGNGRDAVVDDASRSRSARTSSTSRPASTARWRGSRKTLPAGIRISTVYDLAEFVEESIASVRDAILDRRRCSPSSCCWSSCATGA